MLNAFRYQKYADIIGLGLKIAVNRRYTLIEQSPYDRLYSIVVYLDAIHKYTLIKQVFLKLSTTSSNLFMQTCI